MYSTTNVKKTAVELAAERIERQELTQQGIEEQDNSPESEDVKDEQESI